MRPELLKPDFSGALGPQVRRVSVHNTNLRIRRSRYPDGVPLLDERHHGGFGGLAGLRRLLPPDVGDVLVVV
jgi:hypothetical protein